VGEIMEKKVAQLNPNDSALVAIGIFRENLFHALPIVNESNVLVGILTTYDLLTYAYNEPVYMN
jgi:CBS domain-containing protein